MRIGAFFDRFWRPPPTREGRNEQKKALAAVFNAAAITLFIAGLFGGALNPTLAATLTAITRVYLVLIAIGAHIAARAILWTLEDR